MCFWSQQQNIVIFIDSTSSMGDETWTINPLRAKAQIES